MLHTLLLTSRWSETRLRSNYSLLSSWFCYAATTSKIVSSRLATSPLVSTHISRVAHVQIRQCAHYNYGRPTAQAPTSYLGGVRAPLIIECSSLEKAPKCSFQSCSDVSTIHNVFPHRNDYRTPISLSTVY